MTRARRQHQRVFGFPSFNFLVRKRFELAYNGSACQGKRCFVGSLEGYGKRARLWVGNALGYAGECQKRFLERDRIMLRDFPLKIESDPPGDLVFDRETHGCYLPSAS